MTEAEKERAAVVAWLRGNGEAQAGLAKQHLEWGDYGTAATAAAASSRDYATAEAIERGFHHEEQADG